MLRVVAIGVVIGALTLAVSSLGTDWISNLEGGEIAYLMAGLALVGLYLASIRLNYRGRSLTALRHALIWLGLAFALITGYAYREELRLVVDRVNGEMSPPGTAMSVEGAEPGERAVRLRRHPGGAFKAKSEVNGTSFTLIVDTGATTVVLKTADAERAGIDIENLSYSVPVDTANGTTFAASVRLRSIAVGPILVNDVEALVAKPGGLKESLLGMSFLKRLRSYEFSGDFLTLRG